MDMVAPVDGWPYKLLQPERHARLVENLEDVAERAGVPRDLLDVSMADAGCSAVEINWVKHIYPKLAERPSKGGLLLVGRDFDPAPECRLPAMGAAFLRNFIDARCIMVDSLLRLAFDGVGELNPTVLLIPNFHRVSSTGGAGIPNWQLQQVYGLLVERFNDRRASILHIDDEQALIKDYGKSLHDFLWGNFDLIESV